MRRGGLRTDLTPFIFGAVGLNQTRYKYMLTKEKSLNTRRLVEAEAAKEKLNLAFRKLRKMGFIAHQSFKCCNSCGGSAIAYDLIEHLDKGEKKPLGAIYYSRQEGLVRKEGRREFASKLFLRFGSISTDKYGEVGLPTKEVGTQVVEVLESVGLSVNWDGDPERSIEIDPCPRLWKDEAPSRFERID